MKTTLKRLITDERGKVLVLVLVLLVVGGLLLTPLLGLMGTGLASGQVYEKKASELYAADAGVEAGIWHLQHVGTTDEPLSLSLNGKQITVTMTRLNRDSCYEPALYEIISTATNTEGTSSTTVKAHVSGIVFYVDGDYFLRQGDVINGHVWVDGTLELDSDAEVWGNVVTGEDLILNENSLVAGILCVGGDLILNDKAYVYSKDVYVEGNLYLSGGSKEEGGSVVDVTHGEDGENGKVRVRGDTSVDGKSRIIGVAWSGGDVKLGANARIDGDLHMRSEKTLEGGTDNVRITGTVYYDYNENWGCPLVKPDREIKIWLIV